MQAFWSSCIEEDLKCDEYLIGGEYNDHKNILDVIIDDIVKDVNIRVSKKVVPGTISAYASVSNMSIF